MVSNLNAKVLGQRVRQLRIRKGLTQQDLAGEDYSKSYISAIEQGKTRPSLEALLRMASRLEVPAGLLLDPFAPGFAPAEAEAMPRRVRRRRGQGVADGPLSSPDQIDLQLLQAELLVKTGHASQARDMLKEMLPEDEADSAPSSLLESAQLQKAYHLIAEAALSMEQPAEALEYLQHGTQYAMRLGNRDALGRMNNLIGVAHYQAGQPLLALEIHRACLEAIQVGAVRDPNFKLQVCSNIANDYWALHDNDRANAMYEDNVGMFATLDDFSRQADAYWELSSQYAEDNNYTPARLYAGKAINIYDSVNNILRVAEMEANYGMIRLRSGDLKGAEKYLMHSLELCKALRMDWDSVLVMSYLARISLERGDLDAATERTEEAVVLGRQALKEAEANAKPSADGRRNTYIQGLVTAQRALARALAVGGEAAAAKGDAKKADRLFNEAIEIIEKADTNAISGEIYQRYAQTLAGRGQHEKASKYFERAYKALSRA